MSTVKGKSETEIISIGKQLAGKYLTFALDKEEFAIEILKVNQIIRFQEITSIPRTPSFVRGVINLRGMIIPIIDLRSKFSMSEHTDTERTCIVVIQLEQEGINVNMGIVIDEVREVLEIPANDIEPPPEFGINIGTDFIMGIAKTGKNVKMMLDIASVLTTADVNILANIENC